jgi:hypothetical protein
MKQMTDAAWLKSVLPSYKPNNGSGFHFDIQLFAGLTEQATWFQSSTKVLKGVYSKSYNEVPEKFPLVFTTFEGDEKRPFLTMLSYFGFGGFQVRPEGQAPAIDQAGEGLAYTINYLTWALSYYLTKEARIEDVYGIGSKLARLMAISMRTSKEWILSGIHNFGFTSGVNLADGVPLFSTAHPVFKPKTSVTTWSNSLGAIAPTPEAYNQAKLALLLLVDDVGMPIERSVAKIVHHPNLDKVWFEITKSEKAPWTNENQPNYVKEEGEIKRVSYRYYTNPLQWTVMSANGALEGDTHSSGYHFKWANDTWTFYDEPTRNMGHAAEFRVAYGTWDGRGQVGSQGA